MAKITAFNNFRLDFTNPDSMDVGDWVGQPTVSANSVSVPTNAGVFKLSGSGFAFNPQNGQASGTVSGVSFSQNGSVMATITDLSISASEALSYANVQHGAYILVDRLLSGNDTFQLSGANDVVVGLAGSDTIDGGGGVDTIVYSLSSSNYRIQHVDGGIAVRQNGGGTDTLFNVERIQFADQTLALDIEGVAGSAFRLYQAAFDRTPDTAGLSYWIHELDNAKGDMAWMANNFIISDEFRSTYGTPEGVSNADFLNLVYNNVLDRAADGQGFTYWMNELDNGFDRGRVLASFSESVENQANVAALVHDGIWFS